MKVCLNRFPVLLAAALTLAGCGMPNNYRGLTGPRYAALLPMVSTMADSGGDTLRVVSFNIAFARRVDSALVLLTTEPALREADVVLLQEMDDDGTRRLASALGMSYVYYPAFVHGGTGRDFGNAVLSRWPIMEDSKIVLPHRSRHRRTYRTATAVTIQVRERPVRVYSAHLGTMLDIPPGQRREQLRTILEDAALYPRVVIGGDLNSGTVARVAKDAGYAWPTERGPRTTLIGRLDHVLFRGLDCPTAEGSGTVTDVRRASDHRPVWAIGIIGPN
jgi:endonuclease/exonuclease/phosphatase family metal-dependent hydrolase